MNKKFNKVRKTWEYFAQKDLLWSILTEKSKSKNRWDINEFYLTGEVVHNSYSNIFCNYKKNRNIALDYGCGIGRVTKLLSNHFNIVLGIDISHKSLIFANKYIGNEDVYFILNTSEKLSFIKNNSLDFIFSILTLQHNPPQIQKSIFIEFSRVLKVGGEMLLQIPSHPAFTVRGLFFFFFKNLSLKIKNITTSNKHFIPMYCINKRKMIRLIKHNKLELVKVISDFSCGRNFISYTYLIKKT
jgi:ubiquinone/menaquinone biosynthesis C-methylase UbiE